MAEQQRSQGKILSEIIGHEGNHIDDHRRGRESGNETASESLGSRFKENLGEDGVSNVFDLGGWLSQGNNLEKLVNGQNKLDTEYDGYEIEYNSCTPIATPSC